MKETEIIELLSDTEKEFYRLRYIENLTLMEIAERMGYCVRQATRINEKIKSILKNPEKYKKSQADDVLRCKYCGAKISGGEDCSNCREKARLWREFKARLMPCVRGRKLG
jgi:rubrerythrin